MRRPTASMKRGCGSQVAVIFREQIVPMVVDVHPLTLEDRSIEIDLHDPDTHPEHVVIQVAARLEQQKHYNQPADQQDRNRRRIGVAECHRQGNPGDDDGPIGGGVEAVPPDFALIHFAAKAYPPASGWISILQVADLIATPMPRSARKAAWRVRRRLKRKTNLSR